MRFHIQAEVSKVCFEIKETILGDPQFNNIDIEYLMSNESIDNLFKKINLIKFIVQINYLLLHILRQYI